MAIRLSGGARLHSDRLSLDDADLHRHHYCVLVVAALARQTVTNAVRLQLHALACNLGNFMWTLAMPKAAEPSSLTSLNEKLIKVGAKGRSSRPLRPNGRGRVARLPRQMFTDILMLIARLRAPPAPA
jgi:hypothetical protein